VIRADARELVRIADPRRCHPRLSKTDRKLAVAARAIAVSGKPALKTFVRSGR